MTICPNFEKATLNYLELQLITLLREWFNENNIDIKKEVEFNILTYEALPIRYLLEYLLDKYFGNKFFKRLETKTHIYYIHTLVDIKILKSLVKKKQLSDLIRKIVKKYYTNNMPIGYVLPYCYCNLNGAGVGLEHPTYKDGMVITINPFSLTPEVTSDFCTYKEEDIKTTLSGMYYYLYNAKPL